MLDLRQLATKVITSDGPQRLRQLLTVKAVGVLLPVPPVSEVQRGIAGDTAGEDCMGEAV